MCDACMAAGHAYVPPLTTHDNGLVRRPTQPPPCMAGFIHSGDGTESVFRDLNGSLVAVCRSTVTSLGP